MSLVVLILVLSLCGSKLNSINAQRYCASHETNIQNITLKQNLESFDSFGEDNGNGTGLERHTNGLKSIKCESYCYILWRENKTHNGTENIILLQGCWKQPNERKCENKECMAQQESTRAMNNTRFCCCNGNYCNQNVPTKIPDIYQTRLLTTGPSINQDMEKMEKNTWTLIIFVVLSCITFVLFSISILVYKIYRNNLVKRLGKPRPYTDQFSDPSNLYGGNYAVDHLKLATIVGQGRYGSVWQGSMGDQDVAVKIFPSHYRNYFQNERDIYCLPLMEHPSLLNFYGADERVNSDGNVEYLLVLGYAPGGTLIDFLRSHTIDWLSFCKMGLTVVKGLAHLHTDFNKGDKSKPCIAHRDLNSRNILIKADGTCCICDLGLAVQISGSKYFTNGEEQHAETKSINDVGTLRYMAPEILEGAVNLRDCESSLKQIDVYAIGLVLWELVSRCSDIYAPGNDVPAYKQPFENEIGTHPTFEQMQVLVSRKKVRPVLEGNLLEKQGIRLIKETMEDCWDADAEARLTALCIEERLMELQSHRVAMHFTETSPMINSHCGIVPSTTNSLYNENSNHGDNAHIVQFTHRQDEPSHELVIENLVSFSPSDSAHEHSFKNSNEIAPNAQATLQPYQGRNPCMERNLMTQSDSLDDLACNGNFLVDKSSKHMSNEAQYRALPESQSLLTHDYLGQHSLRPATPIPYVQNVISSDNSSSSSSHKQKQTNVDEQHPLVQESPRRGGRFSGWVQLKRILASKKSHAYVKCHIEREDSKSNLLTQKNTPTKTVDTNVTLSAGGKYVNGIVEKSNDKNLRVEGKRPSTLPLNSRKSENNLSRQESLDKFNEVFSVGTYPGTLKDPNMRIKTPGDLPPSVRKVRGRSQSNSRFSLYDDRIMCNIFSEESDSGGKSISTSVPFGMDLDTLSPPKVSDNDVTCF